MAWNNKKEKITQNISEFAEYKELGRMKKPRSPHTTVFLTNDPEKWFINCIKYKTKSGIVAHNDYIIAKDMPAWIVWHKNLGWDTLLTED